MMETKVRAVRSDGARSRRTILEAAARLATVEGLNGLSIGRLAEHIGMSKSGLFGHFGSKEELQLATIDTATEIFLAEVVEPTLSIREPLERLDALCELFLAHVRGEVFPGGCFFAAVAAEFAPHPGAVQDRIKETTAGWLSLFVDLAHDAQTAGELSPDEDLEQFAFEVDSALLMANLTYVLNQDPTALDRGLKAARRRIAQARAWKSQPATA
ncbi:MAG: TetR/AcrR family transcriptional regulator [Dehalococcoidia bacterium]